ncbi:MAG: acetyl-CoA carboxylase biotin carboxyl carrier protein subunit [Ruminococcaceae bacterium]|nr:acetyl-CoA carboxylase biotin carboxyl carrier protein subunit [Oscillospiraceae bacterium]
MKRFTVTVNGTAYDVVVEEVTEGAAPAAPAAAPAPKAAPKAAPAAPKASGAQGAVQIKSPMPGNILKVNVKVGDKVGKDTVVAVLEAMKMENEIFAGQDGTIASVEVAQGASVTADQVLITMN